MRSGIWPATAVACALLGTWTASAPAGGFHTIPRLTPALDYRTGEQYYAPPIPYGHYVGKQIPEHAFGAVHGAAGWIGGVVHWPLGHVHGKLGGLFHRHRGCDGGGCSDCGGAEWGGDSGFVGPDAGYAPDFGGSTPIIQGQTFGSPAPAFQAQPMGQIAPMSGQIIGEPASGPDRMIRDPALRGTGFGHAEASAQGYASPQIGAYGHGLSCGGAGGSHGLSCHGKACGGLGAGCGRGHGLSCHGDACGGLGAGCGHGHGLSCQGDACGDPGAGCFGSGFGGGCHSCGGSGGCGHGLLSLPHSLLGTVHGLPHTALGAVHSVAGTLLHTGDIKYFVGPGGPVPLTPGYVPYIVPTRSPRDFFAFPPYSNLDP